MPEARRAAARRGGDDGLDPVDEVKLRQQGSAMPSTAAAGLSSPVAVTMTVSPVLADAAGTPASGDPAKRGNHRCARQGDPAPLPAGQPCPD